MTVNKFAVLVSSREGKKKQVNIAQLKETIKVIKNLLLEYTGFDIYTLIRKL